MERADTRSQEGTFNAFNPYPILLNRWMGKELGLEASLLFSQIHYQLERLNRGWKAGEALRWYCTSYRQLAEEEFAGSLSSRSVQRHIKKLLDLGLLLTQSNERQRCKEYMIDYGRLVAWCSEKRIPYTESQARAWMKEHHSHYMAKAPVKKKESKLPQPKVFVCVEESVEDVQETRESLQSGLAQAKEEVPAQTNAHMSHAQMSERLNELYQETVSKVRQQLDYSSAKQFLLSESPKEPYSKFLRSKEEKAEILLFLDETIEQLVQLQCGLHPKIRYNKRMGRLIVYGPAQTLYSHGQSVGRPQVFSLQHLCAKWRRMTYCDLRRLLNNFRFRTEPVRNLEAWVFGMLRDMQLGEVDDPKHIRDIRAALAAEEMGLFVRVGQNRRSQAAYLEPQLQMLLRAKRKKIEESKAFLASNEAVLTEAQKSLLRADIEEQALRMRNSGAKWSRQERTNWSVQKPMLLHPASVYED